MSTPVALPTFEFDPDAAAMVRYVALVERKGYLEAHLKQITREMARLEPAVLAELREGGDYSERDVTLSRRCDVSAKVLNADAAPGVFRAANLGHLVKETINPSTLSAWVRRWYLQSAPPPAEVLAVIEIAETERVAVSQS